MIKNPKGRGIVVHLCKNTPEGLLDSLAEKHGWDQKEIPLNSDKHTKCPYCADSTETMVVSNAEDADKLNRNLRARGTRGGPVAAAQASNAALLQAIKDLREEVAALKKGRKGGSE